METKLCRKCGRLLPISSFSVDNHMHDHRACYCKACLNSIAKARKMLRLNAIRLGRNPKLVGFTTDELVKEINIRINNAFL